MKPTVKLCPCYFNTKKIFPQTWKIKWLEKRSTRSRFKQSAFIRLIREPEQGLIRWNTESFELKLILNGFKKTKLSLTIGRNIGQDGGRACEFRP